MRASVQAAVVRTARRLSRLPRPGARSALAVACVLAVVSQRDAGWLGAVLAQALPPTAGTLLEGLELRRPMLPGTPPEVVFSNYDSANTQDRNGRRFLVRGFQFSGNQALSQGQLRRAAERFVDMELNLYELKKAADAVTAYYRNMGYPLAVAIVPAQKVEDGLVRIEIIEGHIGQLTFDGARRYSRTYLQSYVEPLTRQPVVTMAALERSLLLLNDLPGLSAAATLSAGQRQGDSDVQIKLSETVLHLNVSANNFGRDEAGAQRADVTVSLENPLGVGDELVFRRMQAQSVLLDYSQLKYSLPVGSNGARVALSQSTAKYTVAGAFAALEIGGDVTTTELSATYPWARSRTRNVVGSVGLRETLTNQTALATPLTSNRLQLFSAGVSGNWVHADSSATTASAVLTTNFKNNQNNDPGAVLSKLDLDVTHLTGVAAKWDFYFHGNGVTSGSSLPDSEKFSLGGPDSVRGFRSGEMRGDNGYLVTTELRRQFLVAGTVGIASVFHDFGTVGNLGFATPDILSSAGVGVSLYPGRNLQVKVDVAWPLRNNLPVDPGPAPRTWVSATVSF